MSPVTRARRARPRAVVRWRRSAAATTTATSAARCSTPRWRCSRAEGASALTLREVARRAGVTHAAPYRHFADKQALLAVVAEEGFRMLAAEMTNGRRRAPGRAGAGLQAIGTAYVRFATTERAHFQVMFGNHVDWSCNHLKLEETADNAFEVLIAQVKACQAAGLIRPGDPLVAALCAWSMVHGLSELIANGQFNALDLSVPPARRSWWAS